MFIKYILIAEWASLNSHIKIHHFFFFLMYMYYVNFTQHFQI